MTHHIWTVAEAKARMSEMLRLASTEGPQYIGTHKRFVVVPEALWQKVNIRRKPLGTWLVENLPRGEGLPQPDRVDPTRRKLFDDVADDQS